MKESTKKIIYILLNTISAAARLFIRFPRVSILMYHSISDSPAFFAVSQKEFAWQMEYLKKLDYRVIPLIRLIESLKNKEELEDKTIVLTFDDGYVDNFTKAWPLLKKYDFPATIFLSTDYIGRSFVNSQQIETAVLNQRQIKEMSSSGLIEFASHTQTHPHLENISLADFTEEARRSKEVIEELIQKKCRFFAYPRGCFRKDFFAILEGLGYQAAGSVEEGLISKKEKIFSLKRNFIYQSGGRTQFKGKLTYSVVIYNWLKRIF